VGPVSILVYYPALRLRGLRMLMNPFVRMLMLRLRNLCVGLGDRGSLRVLGEICRIHRLEVFDMYCVGTDISLVSFLVCAGCDLPAESTSATTTVSPWFYLISPVYLYAVWIHIPRRPKCLPQEVVIQVPDTISGTCLAFPSGRDHWYNVLFELPPTLAAKAAYNVSLSISLFRT
jgi:hypothetical protein